jgi:tetratricopeptide (TPR) repeat protein
MKPIGSILLILFGPLALQAGTPTLKEARERLLRGNYAEAREQFAMLAKDAKNKVPASIGLSRAHESEGQYEQALAAIDAALKEMPQNPDLLARRAEVLYLRGRWEEADKEAAAALAKDADNFLAHWIKGQVLRDKGEVKKADEEFRWFVRTYTDRSNMDKDITDPDLLVLVGLAGSERARRHNLSEQFKFILNEVYKEAVKLDKSYWPAEYQAGRLLTEKYNKAGAYRAFERALTINPQAAEVYAAKGQAALHNLEIKDAAVVAEQALKINPRLTEALRLQADIHLFGGDMDKAMKELDKARAVNPREEATLARVAACLMLQKKEADFAALVKKVHANNPKPAIFYYELAERLDERKLFDDAEKYYKISIKHNPKIPWAQNGLGILHMRLGQEEEARKVLETAFKADNYNVRVFNTLQVLDHLEKYSTLKTEHFHLRYDPKNDKVLAAVMAKYLEDIYKELAEKFQYRPKGPILIEVFNKHEMFSGRVVALPDLHTIGACTGKMVAMVSPRDKSKVIGKPFNWNRVLRHELVHIFNLEQTKYAVPHWFTEGLAVLNEGTPMPPRWHTLLAQRVASGELMNLDNILLGFARPNSQEEWHLAYLQSLLYVEYLIKTHGQAAVGKLLDAYAAGLDTASGIQKVCKIGKAEFEKGYRAFLQERVKESGIKLPGKGMTLKELKAAHEKDQNDPDIAAKLAEMYLSLGDKKNARHLADAVLIGKKNHPIAAYVKARLLVAGGQPDEALSLLQGVDIKTAEPKVLKLLGKLQLDAKKYADAAGTFELGRKLEPHDPVWLIGLARIYKQSDDQDKLIEVLKALVPTDADDLPTRRELAKMLLKAGKAAEAERYAWQALEIDVLDTVAQETLENALMSQNKEKELKELRKLLEK